MFEIERVFNKTFERHGISLPHDNVIEKRRGKIVKNGFAIWYLFGNDERGEYLDYYVCHRRDFDEHMRIYENGGTKENLPAIEGFITFPEGCTPEQEKRIRAEHSARNRKVAELLKVKGFWTNGEEPVGVIINRFFYLPDEEKE